MPLQKNLGRVLASFDRVLIPEMNMGQLLTVLRAKYLLPAKGLHKMQGKPFKVSEISNAIHKALNE